jgi:prepilin-type N-terminal cleavage/methylation domain-containing protein
MISLKRKQSGFTIVELLIVIVVIGILAAIVLTNFANMQRKARNLERETDVKAVAAQLEAYYNNNNKYPQMSDVNSSTWREASNANGERNMTLEAGALKDPRGASDALCATATATCYGYTVTQADGTTACTDAANDCVKFTLTALKEGGGNVEKKSLN